jgi:hypothetical protein
VRDPGQARIKLAVAAGLFLIAACSSLVKARSYDLWWHLEAGERIVSTLSVPRADDFSFTSAGAPWIDHEWLFQVLLYGFHTLGPLGFTLLKGSCALATAAIGYWALRRSGSSAGTALAVVALSVAGMKFRLTERPEAVSLAMATATAAIGLDLVTRPSSPARRLVSIALVTILWVNMHAGALIAPVIMLACAAGAALDHLRSSRAVRSGMGPVWLAVPITAVSLLVNPFGYHIYTVPSGITEALAPANITNPEWTAPSSREFPLFYFVLLVVAAAALARLARLRPLAGPRLAILLLAAAMALSSVRHIGIFFALLPLMVDLAPAPGNARRGGRLVPVAALTAVLAACAWMIVFPQAGAAIGIGVQPGRFPEKAADFIDLHMKEGRLYNDVSFGGYLIWRGYPVRRVFIDGRNEVHSALLRDLSAAIDDGRRWRDLLDRHGVDGAILMYRPEIVPVVDADTGRRSAGTFSELHFPRSDWALVYWDDTAMVFAGRHGRYSDLARTLEYRVARPEEWALGSFDEEPGPGQEELAGEIRRKLAEEPGCRLALAAAGSVSITRERER